MFTKLTKITLLFILALPAVLLASDGSAINSGDTAWIITATALVLFMTLPGSSFILWRSCAFKELPFCPHAQCGYRLHGIRIVGGLSLQFSLFRRLCMGR